MQISANNSVKDKIIIFYLMTYLRTSNCISRAQHESTLDSDSAQAAQVRAILLSVGLYSLVWISDHVFIAYDVQLLTFSPRSTNHLCNDDEVCATQQVNMVSPHNFWRALFVTMTMVKPDCAYFLSHYYHKIITKLSLYQYHRHKIYKTS